MNNLGLVALTVTFVNFFLITKLGSVALFDLLKLILVGTLSRGFFLFNRLHFKHKLRFAVGVTDCLLDLLLFVLQFEESVLYRYLLVLGHFQVGFGIHHLRGGSDGGHACHVEHRIPIVVKSLLIVN